MKSRNTKLTQNAVDINEALARLAEAKRECRRAMAQGVALGLCAAAERDEALGRIDEVHEFLETARGRIIDEFNAQYKPGMFETHDCSRVVVLPRSSEAI